MTHRRPRPARVDPVREQQRVEAELCAQTDAWRSGFTRRSFLTGLGLVGVAALGSQLVTARTSFSAAATTGGQNAVVVVFLRGGVDGLRTLVPAASDLGLDSLRAARPGLVPGPGDLLPLNGADGWALNKNLAPLLPFWTSGELTFVPGVSVEGAQRSHFEAQALLESGGQSGGSTGWLERALSTMGPGTTFRSLSDGGPSPASLAGPMPDLAFGNLSTFSFPTSVRTVAENQAALQSLYRGFGSELQADLALTLSALNQVGTVRAADKGPQNGAVYPAGAFASSLRDIATLVRAQVGLQVATVDVGGWDTHTNEATQLDPLLASASSALAAFLTDLGSDLRSRTTVVVMSEFGRRVAQNGTGGTDHGRGSLLWLLGGGLRGGTVHGRWGGLDPAALDQGDVPLFNNAFDVLGELAQTRLGAGSASTMFPAHAYQPLGIFT